LVFVPIKDDREDDRDELEDRGEARIARPLVTSW
jgi:hypothetical protein